MGIRGSRLAAIAALASPLGAQLTQYESYFDYLGDHPKNAEVAWAINAQGLGNDGEAWFITQTADIWRVPVGQDLQGVGASSSGVIRMDIGDLGLGGLGFNHLGDPDFHAVGPGEGYVVVPLEGGPCQAMAFLRSADLQLMSVLDVCQQSHSAWAAVRPDGTLFSSNMYKDVGTLSPYEVDWSTIKGGSAAAPLTPLPLITLRDGAGAPLTIHNLQGGEFSPSGELLYLVADGIHVFETTTWHRIAKSSNGSGDFNYQFDDCCELSCLWVCEEPEGLTIWDLDDLSAPGVWGQMHVLMLDNDYDAWGDQDDDIYLKHYSHRRWVDAAAGSSGNGELFSPYATVGEAAANSWSGAEIRLVAGTYAETPTITERVLLTSSGGTVVIR